MLFTSQVYAATSGSIGGTTYSHNRGGQYTRARRIPVNTNTVQQQTIRNAVSQLTTRWQNTLTAAQRTAWSTYAAAVPLVGPLGNTRDVGGLAHYVRSNVPRLQAGLAVVDAGPTVMSLPTFSNPTLTIAAPGSTSSMAFTNTDDWANEVGGAMLVFMSREAAPSINFFNGPYRYAGKIVGAGTPPTSPASLTPPFPVSAGNKIFYRAEVVTADGRLSASFRNGVTAS